MGREEGGESGKEVRRRKREGRYKERTEENRKTGVRKKMQDVKEREWSGREGQMKNERAGRAFSQDSRGEVGGKKTWEEEKNGNRKGRRLSVKECTRKRC